MKASQSKYFIFLIVYVFVEVSIYIYLYTYIYTYTVICHATVRHDYAHRYFRDKSYNGKNIFEININIQVEGFNTLVMNSKIEISNLVNIVLCIRASKPFNALDFRAIVNIVLYIRASKS